MWTKWIEWESNRRQWEWWWWKERRRRKRMKSVNVVHWIHNEYTWIINSGIDLLKSQSTNWICVFHHVDSWLLHLVVWCYTSCGACLRACKCFPSIAWMHTHSHIHSLAHRIGYSPLTIIIWFKTYLCIVSCSSLRCTPIYRYGLRTSWKIGHHSFYSQNKRTRK